MPKISVQKGTLSTQNKTGSKAFEGLGSNCLLCQSTVLKITQLHFFQKNRMPVQPIPYGPSRSWINGLKQLLWSS